MLTFLLIVAAFLNEATAQTCTVKIDNDLAQMQQHARGHLEVFMSIAFEVNHVKIKATDKQQVRIPVHQTGFDTVDYTYTYNGDVHHEQFICKLRAKEKYTISPCTCCGIFLMTPAQNAQRGSVKYINASEQEFISETGDQEIHALSKNSSTDYIHSYISMNCGFRPTQIFIAAPDYLNPKFDYENWKSKTEQEQALLDIEQNALIRFSFNFLFLHDEKLVVTIGESGRDFRVELGL
ncbi:MAG: hypothetical protein RL331_481 [Bacteroidota bacterium]|jgi:hypothetical protein